MFKIFIIFLFFFSFGWLWGWWWRWRRRRRRRKRRRRTFFKTLSPSFPFFPPCHSRYLLFLFSCGYRVSQSKCGAPTTSCPFMTLVSVVSPFLIDIKERLEHPRCTTTQPPTVACKMEAQSEHARIAYMFFAHLAPICMLSRCLSTKISASELRRKFTKTPLLAG